MKFMSAASALLFALLFSVLSNASEIQATHICLDALKRGVALNVNQKTAWWVQNGENSKLGDQMNILANDFVVYRCPECYSFSGGLEKNGVHYKVSGWTHLDTFHKQIWMHYEQLAPNDEQSFGMMLKCDLLN